MSQNAVAPPLPSTTSYPSGSEKNVERPSRTRRTRSFTGFCRCEVPRTVVAMEDRYSTCSGRTLLGPEPKRPSEGLRPAGTVIAGAVLVGVVAVLTWVPSVGRWGTSGSRRRCPDRPSLSHPAGRPSPDRARGVGGFAPPGPASAREAGGGGRRVPACDVLGAAGTGADVGGGRAHQPARALVLEDVRRP